MVKPVVASGTAICRKVITDGAHVVVLYKCVCCKLEEEGEEKGTAVQVCNHAVHDCVYALRLHCIQSLGHFHALCLHCIQSLGHFHALCLHCIQSLGHFHQHTKISYAKYNPHQLNGKGSLHSCLGLQFWTFWYPSKHRSIIVEG
jgi:hypothetical protein